MVPPELVWGILAIFPISEIVVARRKRATTQNSSVQDQGTLRVLWVVITASIMSAMVVKALIPSGVTIPPDPASLLSIVLTIAGLGLRWWSMHILGRYFTVNLAIHPGQQVVKTGPYRYIRHPSYTGLLIAFLGLGVYLANLFSLTVLMIPITLATLHRIKKEEAALLNALGSPYRAYCSETKRLVPWLY